MKEIKERKVAYMSLETGEVVESHDKAMELNRAGELIQVLYCTCYTDGTEGPFRKGPIWEP